MTTDSQPSEGSSSPEPKSEQPQPRKKTTFDLLRNSGSKDRRNSKHNSTRNRGEDSTVDEEQKALTGSRWTLGILADKQTDEVPGTVVLLSRYSIRNIPLGLQHESTRGRSTSRGSITGEADRRRSVSAKKKTPDGQVILDPQPDDSQNDPLNWPAWRRDCALLSLGFYCMVGGGMTPILAAGFNNVATTYRVTYSQVALTTGLYMMGLGVGSVIFSPTAILFGKRPVYLFSSVMFVATSIWCAVAPTYAQLATARVFQGVAVSPVECLPSATIAEIFFLHERAFRIGIYTLLLLGGKNLIPLVSAAIIQSLGWRWVFWIVAIIVGLCGLLLFAFVPETFWDRTPRPRALKRNSESRVRHSISRSSHPPRTPRTPRTPTFADAFTSSGYFTRKMSHNSAVEERETAEDQAKREKYANTDLDGASRNTPALRLPKPPKSSTPTMAVSPSQITHAAVQDDPSLPTLHNSNSPYYTELEKSDDHLSHHLPQQEMGAMSSSLGPTSPAAIADPTLMRVRTHDWAERKDDAERGQTSPFADGEPQTPNGPHPIIKASPGYPLMSYTTGLRHAPAKPLTQTLKVWNGRLSKANWFHVALRPFILYAYPSVLWSSMVYALSVGWLIVLSESVSNIYRNRESYNFSALAVGLVYMSPFIGGVLGTAVAGRFSDVIVRFMARRNDGIYEPEYRLVMAIPITLTTVIGLMGFGWSAEEKDAWIVPTVFFGIISFGCCVGSTTSITFCVDSYRQYAGEALVTLNFSKNIFHGLVWSLFFPKWLEHDGAKDVFLIIGGIQIACMFLTIPMYIYGKRARMWTVRKGLMNKL